MHSPTKHDKRLGVDALFLLHASLCALCGFTAFATPHLYGCFLVPHGELSCWTRVRDNSNAADMEPHLILRLYGAAQLAFAYISWSARSLKDAETRRSIIRAYCAMFALALVALLRAQLARGSILTAWGWVNILIFALLTAGYGYFAVAEPVSSFKGSYRV